MRAIEMPDKGRTLLRRRLMSGIPETSNGSIIYRHGADWFRHRSYDYRPFPYLEEWSQEKWERIDRAAETANGRTATRG